jgi:hypothetical protein
MTIINTFEYFNEILGKSHGKFHNRNIMIGLLCALLSGILTLDDIFVA